MSDPPTKPVAGPSRLRDEPGGGRLSASAIILVLANLFPIYGVLVLDWSVGVLVILFWLENAIVGILNVLRMLTAASPDSPLLGRLGLSAFFTVHYGMFWWVHGTFVLGLFGEDLGLGFEQLADSPDPLVAIPIVLATPVAFALGAIFLSHLISYFYNFLGQREFERTAGRDLMAAPYKRVIALHITILVGGLIVQALDSPLPALLVLLGIKTAIDLRAHLAEHRGYAQDAQARTA